MDNLIVLENVFVNGEISKNENYVILGRPGVGKEVLGIVQNLENIKKKYENDPQSSDGNIGNLDNRFLEKERYYHKFKSNNWLKLHHKGMRRRPFVRLEKMFIMDEAYLITNQK